MLQSRAAVKLLSVTDQENGNSICTYYNRAHILQCHAWYHPTNSCIGSFLFWNSVVFFSTHLYAGRVGKHITYVLVVGGALDSLDRLQLHLQNGRITEAKQKQNGREKTMYIPVFRKCWYPLVQPSSTQASPLTLRPLARQATSLSNHGDSGIFRCT